MRTVYNSFKAVMLVLVTLALLSLSLAPAQSQTGVSPDIAADRTLSPYFFVQGDDPSTDRLPLKATSANVSIAGVIADVRVSQVYRNTGKKPIEAVYVFPGSTRAAVYGMKMTIGNRVIEAKINKREDARREYEKAKSEGRSASLLEQHRPNVFQMNVANIMPGDEIKVELRYTELLVPADGIYEFVYPAVVGPRYSNQPAAAAPASARWLENPYLHEGENPNYDFGIKASIKAGLPIRDVSSVSHKINTEFAGPASVSIGLDGKDKSAGKRDFVLRYRLAGDRIESGLLLYQGATENFFLLMVQPPKRVKPENIPPREYIFIVDVSGSMHGFPLDISKKLLADLVGSLRSTDRFNVLLFSGGSTLLSEESLPATKENIALALNLINRQRGGGGTELLPALNRAMGISKAEGCSRTVVIATDGYVAVEDEVFDLIRARLGEANMFAFGVGSSVNRHIIEGMARVGMGEAFVITKPGEAPEQARRFRTIIESPVLTNVRADFSGFDVYDVEPPSIPDVLAERPVVVFGKWRGEAKGSIKVTGAAGSGPFAEVIDVSLAKPSTGNSALRYLWARHRIALLGDYNSLRREDKRVEEITNLGLKYSLLTAYTSFVAVDSEVRNKGGQQTTVKQPLPLPDGVSDYAVGQYRAAEMAYAPGTFASASPLKAKVNKGGSGYSAQQDTAVREKSEAKADKPKISVTSIKVTGALSREAVLKAVNSHLEELKACGKFRGKLVLKLKIAADGTVKEVKITGAADSTQEKCLEQLVRAWPMPTAKGPTSANIELSGI